MRVGDDGYFQLTYCTNIHPGAGWQEVFANIRHYAPALKARLAPGHPFGLGVRLSDDESRELLRGEALNTFQAFLAQEGLYVFTLNGFPFGTFHAEPVKAQVHAPDWRSEARVAYTERLADILAALLPDGMEGSISTSPLSYKPWVDASEHAVWETMAGNVARVAERLARIARTTGKHIALAIEPEPDGLVETTDEMIAFFTTWLLPVGVPYLARSLGVGRAEAEALLREHVRICLDTCHMAVAYEDPATALDRLDAAGISLGKVQISSALEVDFTPEETPALLDALRPFADEVYLHQVMARPDTRRQSAPDEVARHHSPDALRYLDLSDALAAAPATVDGQWRIHFHVPIFVDKYGRFASTQPEIARMLDAVRQRRGCSQLEIETYTWDVLPAPLKEDLLDSLQREYEWVTHVLA